MLRLLLLLMIVSDLACVVKSKGRVTGETASADAEAVSPPMQEGGEIADTDAVTEISDASFPSATFRELGLFFDGNIDKPKADVLPYSVAVPLWSDGADKQRYLYLPPGTSLGFDVGLARFSFPPGTMLIKHFAQTGADGLAKARETRVMRLGSDGNWAYATYQWMEDGKGVLQNDITYVDGYRIPSATECGYCHSAARGSVLGFVPQQIQTEVEGLKALGRIGENEAALVRTIKSRDNPADESLAIESRVRSYLEVNCASCHRPDGVMQTLLFDAEHFQKEDLLARGYIVPQKLDLSKIWQRFTADKYRMPPVSVVQDPQGLGLLKTWIETWSETPSGEKTD